MADSRILELLEDRFGVTALEREARGDHVKLEAALGLEPRGDAQLDGADVCSDLALVRAVLGVEQGFGQPRS